MLKVIVKSLSLLVTLNLVGACPSRDVASDAGDIVKQADAGTGEQEFAETIYAFKSRFDGKNSVSYSGQSLRQLLIADMKAFLPQLDQRLNDNSYSPAAGKVREDLDFYFSFDSESSADVEFLLDIEKPILQTSYGDVSNGKDIKGKLAGNDADGQHRDWSTEFKGTALANNPEALVYEYFDRIDALAQKRINGEILKTPEAYDIAAFYIDENGLDYRQLTQKFLTVAVTFSQGVDDYLDDDLEGKGLLSSHKTAKEGKNMSALESSWDEAFGYFGAAVNYLEYTDDEIAGKDGRSDFKNGFQDFNKDGKIDLKKEINFALSVNAAKRDRAAAAESKTDFTKSIFEAFLNGRKLLAAEKNELSTEQMTTLKAYRDTIVSNWEKALAATVVHYINAVLLDMQTMGDQGYNFEKHAGHFSELKGFSLGFQFNPRSPMLADFERFHDLIADQPVLSNSDEAAITDYVNNLKSAKDLLKNAYNFSAENMEKW